MAATTTPRFRNQCTPCLAPLEDTAAAAPGAPKAPPLSAGDAAIVQATVGSEERCADPDDYLWYDGVHPTSRGARLLLAEPFLEFLLGQEQEQELEQYARPTVAHSLARNASSVRD